MVMQEDTHVDESEEIEDIPSEQMEEVERKRVEVEAQLKAHVEKCKQTDLQISKMSFLIKQQKRELEELVLPFLSHMYYCSLDWS